MTIQVTSKIFKNGESIPDRYACNGVNVSPSLEWENVLEQLNMQLSVKILMHLQVHGHTG